MADKSGEDKVFGKLNPAKVVIFGICDYDKNPGKGLGEAGNFTGVDGISV
jgi:hypothetical protein